jgi:hypothetical protein
VALVVKDPPMRQTPEGTLAPSTWQPPTMMPDREQLNEARAYLELALKPAGVEGVRKALMPLFLTMQIPNTEAMSDNTQQAYFSARAAEYERLLAHVPVDILKTACDAHVRTEKFFPAISELLKHADPLLEQRKAQQHRVGRMIEARAQGGKKPASPKFEREPEDVRLLAQLRWQEMPGSMLYSPTKARATRARLAELGVDAGDVPPEVASAPLPEASHPIEPPTRVGTFKSAASAAPAIARAPTASGVALSLARAKFWKDQGMEAMAAKIEREIPVLTTCPKQASDVRPRRRRPPADREIEQRVRPTICQTYSSAGADGRRADLGG